MHSDLRQATRGLGVLCFSLGTGTAPIITGGRPNSGTPAPEAAHKIVGAAVG